MHTSIWTLSPEVLENLLRNASLEWPANNDAFEPNSAQDALNFLVARDDGTENAARRCYEKIEDALGFPKDDPILCDQLSRDLRDVIAEKSAELEEAQTAAIVEIAEVAAQRLELADLPKLKNEATASHTVHEVLVAAPVQIGTAPAEVMQWGLRVPRVGDIDWDRITPIVRETLCGRFAKGVAVRAAATPAKRQHPHGSEIT